MSRYFLFLRHTFDRFAYILGIEKCASIKPEVYSLERKSDSVFVQLSLLLSLFTIKFTFPFRLLIFNFSHIK